MSKEAQRAQLHKVIWKNANELRGSVDGWDFKNYILGFLFYRFISENLKDYINKIEHANDKNSSFDYAKLSDKEALEVKEKILNQKGFFILPSQLFENINVSDENLNTTLANAFASIENFSKEHEGYMQFKGLLTGIDVNNAKALGDEVRQRNDKLKKIILATKELNLNYAHNVIDAFGDAYEYLIKMYASNAGKSGGEFFTPQEVSTLLARLTLAHLKEPYKIYDPACGSGSLLLSFQKLLKYEPKYFGQELNDTSYNLARMNMFLHDVNYSKFEIIKGDTLTKPASNYTENKFDIIVSNPPYSTKWIGDDDITLITDERYAPAGILAPKSKADFAFVMHILAGLNEKGVAGIVCFPGIFYRTGAEAKIRRYLVENNFIQSIIALGENLFFGTNVATCIMILNKNKSDDNILFLDASQEFIKEGTKNKLSDDNIRHILKLYEQRTNLKHKAALVSNAEILKDKDCILSVSNFIEPEDLREKINIKALNLELENIVRSQNALRKQIDEIVSSLENEA